MKRDLSKAQFENRATKLGFKKEFMGYWMLPVGRVSVCAANAGKRNRDRLAYLIRENAKYSARLLTPAQPPTLP